MNQSYEQDQCFDPFRKEDEVEIRNKKRSQYDLSGIIQRELPSGNDLHKKSRPINLVPRTCFTQLPFYLLPPQLNEPCEEIETEKQNLYQKQTISNKLNLGLFQYFSENSEYQIVYNKFNLYKDPTLGLTKDQSVRFKNIEFFGDYNEKLFKDLQEQINLLTERSGESFDSQFECGNLGKVYKQQEERKYYLILQNDVNTHGYTNWFFFKVKNSEKGNIKIYIANLLKGISMYKKGMGISIFSRKKFMNQNVRWFKGGDNISSSTTNFLRPNKENQFYSCLYFQYDFQYENDQVYFALNQPYTYSRLIRNYQSFITKAKELQINLIYNKPIYSISNNIIPILNMEKGNQPTEKRKVILFLGRQHPAQTVGSFTTEGIMDFFSSGCTQAQIMLHKYRIIIIPMVNPDGVIHGNSRCNLAGLDLNRKWSENEFKELTPETFHLRKFIFKTHHQSKGIQYLVDSHGHSKKLNSFLFCCKLNDKFKNYYFSIVMSKIQNKFDFYSCTYGITKDKINTIRGQLHDAGIKKSYTLENSYYGYTCNNTIKPYTEKQLKEVGKSIAIGICFITSNENCKIYSEICEKYSFTKLNLQTQINKNQNNLTKIDKQLTNDKEICSDSDPEGDVLNIEERINLCKGVSELDKSKMIKNAKNIDVKKQKKSACIKQRKRVFHNKEDNNIRRTLNDRNKRTIEHQSSHKSQRRLLSASPTKIKLQEYKKRSIRTQSRIQTNNSRPVSRQNHEIQILSKSEKDDSKKRNKKIFPTFIYKYPSYLPRNKDKANRLQNRLKTQILEYVENPSSTMKANNLLFTKKEEREEPSLNQTLSIISMTKDKKQTLLKDETTSILFEENNRRMKIKTQMGEHSEINSSFSLAEKQKKKKLINTSFRNELVKRKISLQRRTDTRYKRFENYKEPSITIQQKLRPQNKIQNSVFYYFPVL